MAKNNSDVAKLGVVELKERAVELKKKLAHMRFEKATGKVIDTSAPMKLKRELARVLTRATQLMAK